MFSFFDAEEHKVECLLHDMQKDKKRLAISPPKASSPAKRQKTTVPAGGSQKKKDPVSALLCLDAEPGCCGATWLGVMLLLPA